MEPKKINFNVFNVLKILTGYLLGFLSAMIIFLAGLKAISSIWGALLGMCVNITIAAFILKKQIRLGQMFRLNSKTLKPFAYGIISAVVLLVVVFFSLQAMILTLFQKVAN